MKKLITRQSDVNDCGPAVIYSLVKYYKGYVSLERIKLDTHLGKTGISAYDMVLALKSYGFDASGLKLKLEDLKTLERPMILHCLYNKNFGHFILLLKATKKKAIVMNPAVGIEKLSWEELESIFSGVGILAIPMGKIVHLEQEKTLRDLFLSTLKVHAKEVFTIVTLGLLINLLGVLINYYLKIITGINNLIGIFITFIFLSLLKGLGSFYLQRKTIKLDWTMEYNLTSRVINHLFLLPLSNLELISKGCLLKYVNDLNLLKETFLEFVLSVFLGLMEIILLCSLLFMTNHILGYFLIGILSIYFVFKIVSINLSKKRLRDTINSSNAYQDVLNETISKVRMGKRLNKIVYFQKRFQRKLLDFLDSNKTYLDFLSKDKVIEDFFFDILNIVSITGGFILVRKNLIELVDLFVYITLSTYLLSVFKKVLEILPKYSYLEENYLHLSEFLVLKQEIFKPGLSFRNGDILFQNVSFTYNNCNYVIKNLNQVIKVSEKVILAGESGTGKSSLVKMLYRFYEPTNGNILINGINLSDYDINSLREAISYVSQDDTLFKGTLRENLTLGEEISSESLKRVIKLCKLDNVINKAPNHLETLILEDETNFSGGEIMRIILARALLRKSNILILDEALSGVDEEMEREIVTNLIKEYPEKTLIYITHRKIASLFDREIKLDN